MPDTRRMNAPGNSTFAERIEGLSGVVARRPALASLILGLLAACGYPPLHAWWLAIPALAAFVALLAHAHSWRAAAWHGWVFGWAHLTLANNWIATAFTHQAKMPEFLGWLAVPLLCVYLAAYPAAAAVSAHFLHRRLAAQTRNLAIYGLLFAGCWIVFEWVRSWAFTGYPWPPLGLMVLGNWQTPGLAAVAPWTGTYALSGLAILLAAAFAELARRSALTGCALLGLAAALLMSVALVDRGPDTDIRYRLVQPLIKQDEINDGSRFDEQFARIAALTRPGQDNSRVVLWPESAIPDYLENGYPQRYYVRMTAGADPDLARRRIAEVIGPQSTLLTGVINLDFGRREGRRRPVSARNSVIAIAGEPTKAGRIEHSYAKAHLVPYGEYLPLQWAFEPLGLSRLTSGTIPYLPGPGPRTFDLEEHGKAGIQICYEIVFSGQVAEPGNRPDYIFNPSNDGWFGSWGPPQHLAQARLRAIEEGLPVLRSTTTGISAVIDARGIVRTAIALGEADARSGQIPAAAPPTLFARLGNPLGLVWAFALIAFGIGMAQLLARKATGR